LGHPVVADKFRKTSAPRTAAASSSKQQQAAASSSKQQQAAASSSKQQQAAAELLHSTSIGMASHAIEIAAAQTTTRHYTKQQRLMFRCSPLLKKTRLHYT
jgi:hypothetical protein